MGDTADGRVLVGGAEHSLHIYDSQRTTLQQAHITKQGGDFQALLVVGDYVYATCHCFNWNYSGTNNWNNPTNFRRVDPIRQVARWDTENFELDTTWWPNGTKGRVRRRSVGHRRRLAILHLDRRRPDPRRLFGQRASPTTSAASPASARTTPSPRRRPPT